MLDYQLKLAESKVLSIVPEILAGVTLTVLGSALVTVRVTVPEEGVAGENETWAD